MIPNWCLVGTVVVRRREFCILLVCHLDSAPFTVNLYVAELYGQKAKQTLWVVFFFLSYEIKVIFLDESDKASVV